MNNANPVLVVLVALVLAMLIPIQSYGQQGNSTRKVRIKPSAFSGQCGSTVQWRKSVQAALDESASTGKPVFWYVPTIRGSFMDRKPVIDRYMMAGPFSWPAIADLLNDKFVPVKAIADASLQKRFQNLKAYDFVEPGFVVVDSGGKVKDSIDQITTVDPYWIASLIARWADVESPDLWSPGIQKSSDAFREGNSMADANEDRQTNATSEQILLSGMIEYRKGRHRAARTIWRTAKKLHPNHPLSWKAAAEAENWGPFVRGFEVHRRLPDAAYLAGTESRGSAAPKSVYRESDLWLRSTDFLLRMQSEDGNWIDSDYDFGGTDSLPNVHVAVTAICGSALIRALNHHPEKESKIMSAIISAAQHCRNPDNVNHKDRDEILWAHAYRVRFFADLAGLNSELANEYSPALTEAVHDLESIQTSRGTWYHEYANSFVTATALTALKKASVAGATVDRKKIALGVASLANDRFNNGAYPYYGKKETRSRDKMESSGSGKIAASAGRMPLCELGLWQWNESSDEQLQFALQSAFKNHKYLAVGYKYDDHTSTMAYGGFFFWYDMRSRAEALAYLADGELKKTMASQHRKLVLALPELDGCFVDSHELGRSYGTAMALLTLSILDTIERP